jgi:hypothetical protein
MNKPHNYFRIAGFAVFLSGFVWFLIVWCFPGSFEQKSAREVRTYPAVFMEEHIHDFTAPDTIRPLLREKQEWLDTINGRDLVQDIYKSRTDFYTTANGNLMMVLDLLLVSMLLGVFILFYRPKELEIPLVKITLPDKLFYLVIPVGIVYLFFRLGLAMNAAIDSRLVLEAMTDHMETLDGTRISYYYSNARTLVDQGLVDAWCTWYYDIFEGGRKGELHQKNASWMLFGCFGTMWGLSQAVCLNLISAYHKEYKRTWLSVLLMLFSVSVFFGWATGTMAWYPHSADLLAWIWGVSALGTGLWELYARKVPLKVSEPGSN